MKITPATEEKGTRNKKAKKQQKTLLKTGSDL